MQHHPKFICIPEYYLHTFQLSDKVTINNETFKLKWLLAFTKNIPSIFLTDLGLNLITVGFWNFEAPRKVERL